MDALGPDPGTPAGTAPHTPGFWFVGSRDTPSFLLADSQGAQGELRGPGAAACVRTGPRRSGEPDQEDARWACGARGGIMGWGR